MGFQQPPTLPDYSKLTFMLNSSGVQKWNPAVFDILKNLIAAVQQSQDTFISTIIDSVVNNSINNGGIIIPTPGGGGAISVTTTVIGNPIGKTLFSAPVVVLPGVGGQIIILLAVYIHCIQPATYFFSRDAELAYDVIPSTPVALSALGSITQIQTNGIQDVVKLYQPNSLSSGALASLSGKSIWLQTGADNNVGGFDPTDSNKIALTLLYTLL